MEKQQDIQVKNEQTPELQIAAIIAASPEILQNLYLQIKEGPDKIAVVIDAESKLIIGYFNGSVRAMIPSFPDTQLALNQLLRFYKPDAVLSYHSDTIPTQFDTDDTSVSAWDFDGKSPEEYLAKVALFSPNEPLRLDYSVELT